MPHSPESNAAPSAGAEDASGKPHAPDTSGDEVDVALMLRVGDGDEQAFEELIERHQSAVIGTVAKMLGNASDAEDIAQQVFIRLWKSAPRYQATAKFTTFLFTIARNLVFNESRRRSRKKEYSMDERQDDFHLQTQDDVTASPDDVMLQNELRAAVDKAIADLPEKQRLAVILRRYEGMPYDEIGRVLELSVSAVKSQLFRARNTLRDSLQEYLES
ncbi:MAG: sigma-70 family RNA polymerase sigma factor [Akkermansiaceae bacterium]|nr:sigma-70 family RNA polymerase sigma factor [Akkermansiaceae bacterium]